eukprot:GHVP01044696.1.p1 GENE.GHVP01044696.1~~GHVP01044696.1.p1  ORF type:complete len:296 (-),score=42.73 GHVP01044696.1:115-1002(-)
MNITKDTADGWRQSKMFKGLSQILRNTERSIRGRFMSDCLGVPDTEGHSLVVFGLEILERIEFLSEGTQTTKTARRYGDLMFRVFYDKMADFVASTPIPIEIRRYLVASFGNRTRIDYGSGHELSFFIFMVCYSYYKTNSMKYIEIFIVFDKYIRIVQKTQKRFCLEPAGSKGVWGLDDYQFLSIYFGTSQLINRPEFEPPEICFESAMIEQFCEESLYMQSLKYIQQTKIGTFEMVSPFLFDEVRGNPWEGVTEDLFCFYLNAVLSKHQAIHHITFGDILSSAVDSVLEETQIN